MKLPKYYQKLKNMPEDPKDCEVYGFMTNLCQALIKVFPISENELMPLEEKYLIDGIHSCLGNDQGLIEVGKEITEEKAVFIYSIVKTHMEPSGVQYFLRMHFLTEKNGLFELDGFFIEQGTTGIRDSTIYAMKKGPKMEDWCKDPYDSNYKKGLLMNQSEQAKYDEMFPEHPLTVCRNLINFILENN